MLNMHRTYLIMLFTIFLLGVKSFSNTPEPLVVDKLTQINALNKYVHFLNESVHGVHIIQKLLETYNQELNRFVGLESTKVNFYSNKDLPKDIFEDPENWFYNPSPYQWFDRLNRQSTVLEDAELQNQLNQKAREIKSILQSLNSIRFQLDQDTIGLDLSNREDAVKVYEILERAVVLHDNFYSAQLQMEEMILKAYSNIGMDESAGSYGGLRREMNQIYKHTRDILKKIRRKESDFYDDYLHNLEESKKRISRIKVEEFDIPKNKRRRFDNSWSLFEEKIQSFHESTKRFYEYGDVAKEYKLYGKYYYYHNFVIISKFNRYGNGIVFEMNKMMEILGVPGLLYIEHPHFFQVVYPKEILEVEHIAATTPKIEAFPSKLKERDVRMNTQTIRVDSTVVEFLLFDHLIEDGDIVSISFNGDWILEKEILEKQPKKLKLKLNETGRNYIILHSDDVGSVPPNTMGISWVFQGRKRQIILRSDDNVSELIEIVIDRR
jgi:hypothetical protein